jgi:hypothetical protein
VGERKRARVVEVEPSGLTWRKSTASGGNDQSCVEVATLSRSMLVRNSRDRQGPRLAVPFPAWTALLAAGHTGVLDLVT